MADPLALLTALAALGSGLVAGIFFAFSTFVMGALGRLPAPHGIAAMQSINVVVLNPLFFAAFFGTALLCAALAVAALAGGASPRPLLLAGGALYLVGTILVTITCNVPLNDRLARAVPDSAEGAALWRLYRTRWTAWNHVRTAAALAAAACFTAALL
ncbi:DUF1772 domain-containing protein [Azospirillum sp. ST 5-10]|uniref:anthrone oxygenase family protein n=1 Tax=unclassified Azospirillum TaxID=2630922 RepID=UPI003F4A11FE